MHMDFRGKRPIPILTFVAVIAIVALVSGCGGRRSEQARGLGDIQFNNRQYDNAEKEYRRAIELNPQNAMAHLGLARCAGIKGDVDFAVKEFREAIKYQSGLRSAWIEGVQNLVLAGKPAEAEALAKEYQSADPQNGGEALSLVYLETGREAEAATLLTDLVQKYPASEQLKLNLAYARMKSGKAAEAGKEIAEYVDKEAGNSITARMLLGKIEYEAGQGQVHSAKLRTDHQMKPGDPALNIALASALADGGLYDESELMARDALESPNKINQGWAAYILAKINIARKEYAKAIPLLQMATRAIPDQPLIVCTLRDASSQKTKTEPGELATAKQSEPAATTAPASPVPSSSSSWKQLWDNADLSELCRHRDGFLNAGDPDVLDTIALAALFIGDMATLDEVFAKLPPESNVASYISVMRKIYAGSRDEATYKLLRDTFANWKEETPERQVLRENAEGFALSQLGFRAQAFSHFTASIKKRPTNGVPLFNLAIMYRNARMPEFAAGCLRKLLIEHPDSKEPRFVLFRVLDDGENIAAVRSQAESTRGLFPDEPQSAIDLATVYLRTGEIDLAIDLLQKSIESKPSQLSFKVLLSKILLAQGDAASCLTELDSIPPEPRLAAPIREVRCLALAATGDWAGIETLISQSPVEGLSESIRLVQASARIREGKPSEISSVLALSENSRPEYSSAASLALAASGLPADKLDPKDSELAKALTGKSEALADVVLGHAFARANFYKAAYDSYTRAQAALGDDPRLSSLIVVALTRAPQIPNRLELAKAIVEKLATKGQLWLDLADLYASIGDVPNQRAALDKAVSLIPDSPDAWFRLAGLADKMHDLPTALAASQRLLELLPKDPGVLNNVAYYMLETKADANEALKYANSAAEMLPSNANAVHTLGLAYMRTGDKENAKVNLSLALEFRPGDPTVLLDMGQLLIQTGDKPKGLEYIELSMLYSQQLGIAFPRKEEAEQALRER
jgi:tetratricopeptide (TPR) repeat protein